MIYIDSEYRCHGSNPAGTFREVEQPFFAGKCRTFLEGYRYVPAGESWTRSDGVVFPGEMLAPWKPYSELDAAQRAYEAERALQLRPVIEQASQSLEDAVALTAVELFPDWKALVEKAEKVFRGFRFRYDGKLYRTRQPEYTFVDYYLPGTIGTESLFSLVDVTHSGTKEDPIPFEKNMEIFEGLYYSQEGVLYRCIRSSGEPVYHDLDQLAGSYVEVIA